MELKGRLKLIGEKVPECGTACDIGTDHGYIPIYLIQKNICKKAIAADVKEGPLKAANENISRLKLEDCIETRLGNGLEPIGRGEADSIIIAGMGGNLIAEILQGGIEKAKEAKSLVLQPMNDIDVTRRWLYGNGFEIYDEELSAEGEKIYNVICARWTGENTILDDEIYYQIGKRLFEKKDPLLNKAVDKKIMQLERAVEELRNASQESNAIMERYRTFLEKLRCLQKSI